jgi:hypothetical protein
MEVVQRFSLATGAVPQTRQYDPPVPIVPRSWDLRITLDEVVACWSLSSSNYPARGAFCLDLLHSFPSLARLTIVKQTLMSVRSTGEGWVEINSNCRAIFADVDHRVDNLGISGWNTSYTKHPSHDNSAHFFSLNNPDIDMHRHAPLSSHFSWRHTKLHPFTMP